MNQKAIIKILLVDDQSIVREGLASLLALQPDLEIVGEAENGKVAVEQAKMLQPDLVLMDLRMPIMDGIAASKILIEQVPASKILVLTTFDDDELVSQAIANGAKGYLLKDTPSNELAQAIRTVNQGYSQMSPGILAKALQPNPPLEKNLNDNSAIADLTDREQEVLEQIAQGYNNREIAQNLFITERTVKNHINHILRTLDLRDRTQAAIFYHTQLNGKS